MKTQNFKVITAYEIDWLKNATMNDSGAQQMVIDSSPEENIVIKSYTSKNGHIYADINPEIILDAIKFDFNLMEIITNDKHKIYFDIDAKTSDIKDKTNYRESVIEIINNIFPNSDMAISGSENEYKYSYHITLNNYMSLDSEDKNILKRIVKYMKTFFNDIDISVYSKNRCMKYLNQSKPITKEQPLKRIQKILLNDDPKKHLITGFFNPIFLKLSDVIFNDEISSILDIEYHNEPLNISVLPKTKPVIKIEYLEKLKNVDYENISNIDLLNLAPINKEFNHAYTFFVMLFCFNNDLTIQNYINWYAQKTTDENKINNKITGWETLNKYKIVNKRMMINLLSVYYPEFKKYKQMDKMNDLMAISKYNQFIHYSDKIEQDHFNSIEKNIIFNYGMGAGKTTETIKYIKNQLTQKPDLKVLFISPNITLSRGIHFRLNQEKLGFEHYDIDYKSKVTRNKKQKLEMASATKLIVCINSLHYLNNNRFDIIIYDESDTTLNKWFDNKTLNENQMKSIESWNIFNDLFLKSTKNIFLDAFITNLTLDYITAMPNQQLKIYQRLEEKSDKSIYQINTFNRWLQLIINTINQNKKVYIFYPYNNGNSKCDSMTTIKQTIEQKTNKKGIMYNADIDDKIINDLDDVAKAWTETDFIITNSKITVGINYELKGFDCVFLSIAGFSSPRDVLQSSARCRQIESNNIYIHFLDLLNTNKTFVPKNYLTNECNIYNKLAKNIISEKTAPLKTIFYRFCKIAGYKTKEDHLLNEMKDDIDMNLNELIKDNALEISFNYIEDISNKTARTIQDDMINNNCSFHDKLKLKKYFFLKKFNDQIIIDQNVNYINDPDDLFNDEQTKQIKNKTNIYNPLVDYMFDNNYTAFIDAVSDNTLTEFETALNFKNIFQMIKEHNKWAIIFPENEDIKKTEFNDEILDLIFNDDNNKYHFKNLTRKSKPYMILRDILEKEFNKPIIDSKTKDKKHYTFSISDKKRDILNYCLKVMIIRV